MLWIGIYCFYTELLILTLLCILYAVSCTWLECLRKITARRRDDADCIDSAWQLLEICRSNRVSGFSLRARIVAQTRKRRKKRTTSILVRYLVLIFTSFWAHQAIRNASISRVHTFGVLTTTIIIFSTYQSSSVSQTLYYATHTHAACTRHTLTTVCQHTPQTMLEIN